MTAKNIISVKEETKNNLDKIKLCSEKSHDSVISRILPKWAESLLKDIKENEEKQKAASLLGANGEATTS